jgi:hypothetical protein
MAEILILIFRFVPGALDSIAVVAQGVVYEASGRQAPLIFQEVWLARSVWGRGSSVEC